MEDLDKLDELRYIKKVMQDSKRIIAEDGHSLIFWGLLVTIGQLITFFVFFYNVFTNYYLYVWPVLIFIGWSYTIYYNRKKYGKMEVHTFAGKILGAVWVSFGISATILGFIPAITGAIKGGGYINPLIGTILGAAYFITGYIYGKKWVSNIAFGWWIGSIYMFFFPNIYSLLVMSCLLICLQILPGIFLRIQYFKELQK
ncbi:MAG TPA: hypothetical protein PL041_05765 [Melioribacteraceae bacterium]|nr:hypothetical protein [Melioribacteraceae bacterium]